MTDMAETTVEVEAQRSKEAYFTASQRQLIWARFKKQRAAMVAAAVLVVLIVSGIFAPFLSPYDPTIAGRNKDYTNGAPQIPKFCDKNGCSLRPFIHAVERERSLKTNFRWVTTVNEDERNYVTILPKGDDYRLFGFIPGNRHLFGVQGRKDPPVRHGRGRSGHLQPDASCNLDVAPGRNDRRLHRLCACPHHRRRVRILRRLDRRGDPDDHGCRSNGSGDSPVHGGGRLHATGTECRSTVLLHLDHTRIHRLADTWRAVFEPTSSPSATRNTCSPLSFAAHPPRT